MAGRKPKPFYHYLLSAYGINQVSDFNVGNSNDFIFISFQQIFDVANCDIKVNNTKRCQWWAIYILKA